LDLTTHIGLQARARNGTTRKVLVSVSVPAAALAFVLASPASASPPATVTGTYTVTSAVLGSSRTAGNNTFATYSSVSGVYAGGLSGSFTVDGITSRTQSDGSLTAQGTLVCTGCTIGGRTGDFVANLVNTSPGPKMGGTVTVLRATGGLAGLHAVNHFDGTPFSGDTSWAFHFDP
jgi:hypothetical protein